MHAGILNTTKFISTIYVALVQANPFWQKRKLWFFEATQHEGIQCVCQPAIMQFFSVKGQQKHCTTYELLHSNIYCANEKLFYTACPTKSLAPQQELVSIANGILSQTERLLKSLNTKSSI